MKKPILLCALLALSFLSAAHADVSLPFYEPFPAATFPNGTQLSKNGPAEWDTGNSSGAGGWLVTNTCGLAYPGLSPGSESGLLRTGTPGSGRDVGLTFTNSLITLGPGTNAYASFLLDITALPTNTTLIAHLFTGTSGGGAVPSVGVWLDPLGELLVTKNDATAPTAPASSVSLNTTNLIVMRYQYVAGASNDVASVWINPGSLGVTEPNVPAATISTNNPATKDVSAIGSFFLSNLANNKTGTASGTLILDEIRVGLTWADVTPTGATPLPVLAITNIALSGGMVTVMGTGGSALAAYAILTSTNIATPLAAWNVVATNTFDFNGNFSFTNTPADLTAPGFYTIRFP